MSVQGLPEKPPRPRSSRFGVVEIAGELFPEAVQLLANHGLDFVATLASDRLDVLRVMVSGDVLPDQCGHGVWLVTVTITTSQRPGYFRTKEIAAITPVRQLRSPA